MTLAARPGPGLEELCPRWSSICTRRIDPLGWFDTVSRRRNDSQCTIAVFSSTREEALDLHTYYEPSMTHLTSRYSSRAHPPFSRPHPLSLKPVICAHECQTLL